MNNQQYKQDLSYATGYDYQRSELFGLGTRDFKDLKSYRMSDGTIFLDKIKRKLPKFNPFKYWDTNCIELAMIKTMADDKRRVDYLNHPNMDTKTILDYGCGNGGFADVLYGSGHDPSILLYDTNKRLVKKLNQYFYDMIRDTIAIDSLKDIVIEFDIVTMWHCLEHIANPLETLLKIKDLMIDGAQLYIEVPNAHDFMIKRSEDYALNSLWSEHLVIYTKNSLTKLVEMAGFKVVTCNHIQRYSELNNRHWMQYGYGLGDLVTDKTKTAYEYSLERDGISDTLLLIARK